MSTQAAEDVLSKTQDYLASHFDKNIKSFIEKSDIIKSELERSKQIHPDSVNIKAIEMCLAQFILSVLPSPVKTIISSIDTIGDSTIKGFEKEQTKKYQDELIAGVHSILKKHNLRFDDSKDMHIIFDNFSATIPKESLKEFNIIQKFVESAELVYKEITSKTTFELFGTIQEKHEEFKKHSENVQKVRVDFLVEPKSYLGEVVKEFEKKQAENEKLYKTPRKETSMSSTTASFETHTPHPSPKASCNNAGGKINICIMIPIVVCSIPFGPGAVGASLCSIM